MVSGRTALTRTQFSGYEGELRKSLPTTKDRVSFSQQNKNNAIRFSNERSCEWFHKKITDHTSDRISIFSITVELAFIRQGNPQTSECDF